MNDEDEIRVRERASMTREGGVEVSPNIGKVLAMLAIAVVVGGCGGGGGKPGISPERLDELNADPRVMRLRGIVERADTLLIPSAHVRYTVSAQGQSESGRESGNYYCTGTLCRSSSGNVSLDDLIDDDPDVTLQEVDLLSRGGFTFGRIRSGIDFSESVSGASISVTPDVEGYGLWGQYGYAYVSIASGPFSGRLRGIPFRGTIDMVSSVSVGDRTGTNPGGVGSARWQGYAVAASTRLFQHREGTATIVIPDLSIPRLNVDISVAGYDIGSPSWNGIRVHDGRYTTGFRGSDYIEGNFHGPVHGETYGVFDTGAYIGAFGAARTP